MASKPTSWHLPKLFFDCSTESQLPHFISFLFIQTHGLTSLCCWGLVGSPWLRTEGTYLLSILWLFYTFTQPCFLSLTEYGVGKWLITAPTRFTVQGALWILLQRSAIHVHLPKWLLPCSKCLKCTPGPRTALPTDQGFSGIFSTRRCSVAQKV